jgi:hypothetical protein
MRQSLCWAAVEMPPVRVGWTGRVEPEELEVLVPVDLENGVLVSGLDAHDVASVRTDGGRRSGS